MTNFIHPLQMHTVSKANEQNAVIREKHPNMQQVKHMWNTWSHVILEISHQSRMRWRKNEKMQKTSIMQMVPKFNDIKYYIYSQWHGQMNTWANYNATNHAQHASTTNMTVSACLQYVKHYLSNGSFFNLCMSIWYYKENMLL